MIKTIFELILSLYLFLKKDNFSIITYSKPNLELILFPHGKYCLQLIFYNKPELMLVTTVKSLNLSIVIYTESGN